MTVGALELEHAYVFFARLFLHKNQLWILYNLRCNLCVKSSLEPGVYKNLAQPQSQKVWCTPGSARL